ncbi:MAG: hypothetical protein ACLTYN_08045 [Dysosmobacter welbionis]
MTLRARERRTKEQRTKLLNWYDKAVSECGDTYTDIVYIGTLLHFDSLLANVCRKAEYKSVKYQGVLSWAVNTDLWDAWEQLYTNLADPEHEQTARAFFEANRADMLEGTAVLWEEKNDYYALMCKRVNIGPAAFNSEIQNNPIDPSTCTFQEEWFDYWDDEGKTPPNVADPRFLFVGANDPSLGKNKRADTSSIFALAKTGSPASSMWSSRTWPSAIRTRSSRTCWKPTGGSSEFHRPYYRFGVETVQFQAYFAEVMRQKAAKSGEYLPIVEINSTQNKDARIRSLQPFVKNGYIKSARSTRLSFSR